MKSHHYLLLIVAFITISCKNTLVEHHYEQFTLIKQTKGPDLGYNSESGVKILRIDGYAFKDLNL